MKTPIEILLDKVDYKPVDAPEYPEGVSLQKDFPYVTHEGIIKLGDLEIKVCVLNDGRRIIPEEEMQKFIDYLAR